MIANKSNESSVFGDDKDGSTYSGETLAEGRPTRKNAGRRTLDPNYVNSTDCIKDAIGDLIEENKSIKSSSKTNKHMKALDKFGVITRKRARSPELALLPLSPIGFPTDMELEALEAPIDPRITLASELEPINIVFSIPPGFHGPLHLSLDPSTLLRLSTPPSTRQNSPLPFFNPKRRCLRVKSFTETESEATQSDEVKDFIQKNGPPRGFCELPPGKKFQIFVILPNPL
jgi:hypothetical protein